MPTISAERLVATATPARVSPTAPVGHPFPTAPRLLRVTVPQVRPPAEAFKPAHVVRQDGHTLKRVIDVAVSLVALVVVLPLMLVIAVAVKLSSPGPVLFRQERVGRNGQRFDVIKFRSMQTGTQAALMQDELARRRYQHNDFKLDADDPRITWVGRIIRATSLDELPQLVNVLVGDMSLVGIRPLLGDELALRPHYDQECYRAMRPGMTGLWQVSGRSSVAHDSRHALDRRYVENWNLCNDLKLLLLTPIAVLNIGNTR